MLNFEVVHELFLISSCPVVAKAVMGVDSDSKKLCTSVTEIELACET